LLQEFIISFNQRTRLANWVLEKLTPKDLFSNGQFDRPYFYNEQNLDELYSVTEQDYWDLPKQVREMVQGVKLG
jgi:DNA/RNA endonuclease G (NUC1)